MAKPALIMIKLDAPAAKEAEWNRWYNNKHIQDRVGPIKGFLSARRFTKMEGFPKGFCIPGEPKYLSLYDLEGIAMLKSKAYAELIKKEAAMPANSFESMTLKLSGFARGIYDQIFPEKGDSYSPPPTRYVFVVGHEVPRNRQQEFNAWYDTEHIVTVLKVPGFVAGRRFKLNPEIPPMLLRGGTLATYLTVYDLESPAVLESDAFWKASVSPWSTWVRSWFSRKMCMLYERIFPEQ